MLLAVEGGGFFSSSASGYSKGLTLLLLGKKPEEKPMRVSPWNQYQLVVQEPDQLASSKNRLVRGCASFLCFGRAAAGLESPSPLKVGPTQNPNRNPNQQDVLKSGLDSEKVCDSGLMDDRDNDINGINDCSLRSSLKRPVTTGAVSEAIKKDGSDQLVQLNDSGGPGQTERRVQWTDGSGGELFVVREFEPSEHNGSDDEFEDGNERTCLCRLM